MVRDKENVEVKQAKRICIRGWKHHANMTNMKIMSKGKEAQENLGYFISRHMSVGTEQMLWTRILFF
jgi:hypothetical protein